MDRCSYFIKDKAMFGSYPSQISVEELEKEGVCCFLDLTCEGETGITKYITNGKYITYPIQDRKVPYDWKSFSKLIITISNIIKGLETNEKIYIHCRGGHGRSGIVVACILCFIYKMHPVKALRLTSAYHSVRKEMREKWRKIGSPQTNGQKYFVFKFFEPIYFYKAYKRGYTSGFSNFSYHSVNVDELGSFSSAVGAFNAFKDPTNIEYINKQLCAPTPIDSKHYGLECKVREDWDDVKDDIMLKILTLKFDQHIDIRENLINTGLRPIVYHSLYDTYWGDGYTEGKNVLGKILVKIRNRLYIE